MSAEQRRTGLPFRLRDELPLMSIAFLMGFLIWIIAATQTTETQRHSIRLVAVGVPTNVEIELYPPQVEVELTMPTSLVGLVSGDDFEITVNLVDAARRAGLGQPAEWEVPISLSQNIVSRRDTGLIDDVTFTDPYPAACTVSAQIVAEVVDLQANLTGTPPAGQHLEGEVTVQPSRLWVTGEGDLSHLADTALMTRPVNLANLGPGPHTLARLPELPPGVRVVGVSDPETGIVERVTSGTLPEVTITLTMQEDIIQRRFAGVEPAIEEILLPEGLALADVNPARFTVTLEGPATALDAIENGDLILTAPLLATLTRAGTSALQVEAHLGGGVDAIVRDRVTVVEVQPAQVNVTLDDVTAPEASPE